MRCPECKSNSLRVKETRNTPGNKIRRRRDCLGCGYLFTTYEHIETPGADGKPVVRHYPVRRLDTGEVFSSCAEASRRVHVSSSAIYRAVTGVTDAAFGIRWEYVEPEEVRSRKVDKD